MRESSVIPDLVHDRARRIRARIGRRVVELDRHALQANDPVPELDDGVNAVLLVAALPDRHHSIVEVLADLRDRLGEGGELLILERTRPFRQRGFGMVVDRVRGDRGRRFPEPPDVAAAVRASGWTVAAIERVEIADGPNGDEVWVDIEAVAIGPGGAPTGA